MTSMMLRQFDRRKGVSPILPKTESLPLGATEKLVREEVKKLTENSEEIRKLKEQVEKKTTQSSDK